MSVAVASVEKINALKTGIEATTGESYNDLTEAVQDLKNGYGQSGGGSGEVGKPYIDTSKMTDFTHFCVNDRFNDCGDMIDTSNMVNANNMFTNSKSLTQGQFEKFELHLSKVKSANSMFSYCSRLKKIDLTQAKNCEDLSYTFNACTELEEASIDLRVATSMSSTFSSCTNLKKVAIVGCSKDLATTYFKNTTKLTDITIGEGWAVSIYLTYSNNLSVESLHGMIENLADLTGATAKTFSVGATNLAKIDEDHIAMLNAKNWAYS